MPVSIAICTRGNDNIWPLDSSTWMNRNPCTAGSTRGSLWHKSRARLKVLPLGPILATLPPHLSYNHESQSNHGIASKIMSFSVCTTSISRVEILFVQIWSRKWVRGKDFLVLSFTGSTVYLGEMSLYSKKYDSGHPITDIISSSYPINPLLLGLKPNSIHTAMKQADSSCWSPAPSLLLALNKTVL